MLHKLSLYYLMLFYLTVTCEKFWLGFQFKQVFKFRLERIA
uniref:Uncharacterized protein n=1 Tax=Manihot esculenta TaxID=3983 RepID=A0A2C9V7E3_MANES